MVADQVTCLALQNWWQDVVEAYWALEQCRELGSLAGQTSRGQGHGRRRRRHRPSHRADASGCRGRGGYCSTASSPVLSSTCFPRSESSTSGSGWGRTAHSFQLRSVWETAERTGTSSSGYYRTSLLAPTDTTWRLWSRSQSESRDFPLRNHAFTWSSEFFILKCKPRYLHICKFGQRLERGQTLLLMWFETNIVLSSL